MRGTTKRKKKKRGNRSAVIVWFVCFSLSSLQPTLTLLVLHVVSISTPPVHLMLEPILSIACPLSPCAQPPHIRWSGCRPLVLLPPLFFKTHPFSRPKTQNPQREEGPTGSSAHSAHSHRHQKQNRPITTPWSVASHSVRLKRDGCNQRPLLLSSDQTTKVLVVTELRRGHLNVPAQLDGIRGGALNHETHVDHLVRLNAIGVCGLVCI